MKKTNEKFYELISTENGAKSLIEAIVEAIGASDFLQCIFFDWTEADQESFVNAALSKLEVA